MVVSKDLGVEKCRQIRWAFQPQVLKSILDIPSRFWSLLLLFCVDLKDF